SSALSVAARARYVPFQVAAVSATAAAESSGRRAQPRPRAGSGGATCTQYGRSRQQLQHPERASIPAQGLAPRAGLDWRGGGGAHDGWSSGFLRGWRRPRHPQSATSKAGWTSLLSEQRAENSHLDAQRAGADQVGELGALLGIQHRVYARQRLEHRVAEPLRALHAQLPGLR